MKRKLCKISPGEAPIHGKGKQRSIVQCMHPRQTTSQHSEDQLEDLHGRSTKTDPVIGASCKPIRNDATKNLDVSTGNGTYNEILHTDSCKQSMAQLCSHCTDTEVKRRSGKGSHTGLASCGLISQHSSGYVHLGQGAVVGHWPKLVPGPAQVFQILKKEAPWVQSEVMIFGKPVLQPRLVCYMADDVSKAYGYSGAQMAVQAWHPEVARLKVLAEAKAETKFNSCLLNLYRDGKDSVGWHSDDERLYGNNPTICSISLGASRDFQMRRKDDHSVKQCYCLGSGDVFVMKGAGQLDVLCREHADVTVL